MSSLLHLNLSGEKDHANSKPTYKCSPEQFALPKYSNLPKKGKNHGMTQTIAKNSQRMGAFQKSGSY